MENEIDPSKKQHPPAPPDFENDNLREVYSYCPELNPISRMVAAERASQPHVLELLDFFDQFLLETPTVSAGEEEASDKESGEIVSPANDYEPEKILSPPKRKFSEIDDSSMAKIYDLVSEEKNKKVCVHQIATKDKEDKYDKKGKIKKRHKRSRTKNKTFSTHKKSRKSSAKELLSSDHSKSSSPIFEKASRFIFSETSSNNSLNSPKLPIVVESRRHKSLNSCYASNQHRSERISQLPDIEPMDGRRSGRKSSRYWSPIRRYLTRCSPSPSPHRRSSKRCSPSPSPHRRSSKRCSPSPSPHRRSSKRCSPSPSPHRRSSKRWSPSPPPHRRSSKRWSPSPSHHRRSSKRWSPSLSPHRRSSKRWSPSPPPHRRSSKRRYQSSSPPCRSSKRWYPSPSPHPRFSKHRSPSPSSRCWSSKRWSSSHRSRNDSPLLRTTVIGQKSATSFKAETPSDNKARLSEDQENPDVVEPKGKDGASFPQAKFLKQEDIKSELPDKKGCVLNSYYCQVCQLGLNSELTWQSHISGKKHAKMLKLQTVHQIARGSIVVPSTPEIVSEGCQPLHYYEQNKRRLKKSFELNEKLLKHERKNRRRRFKVFKKDDPMTGPLYEYLDRSWRNTSSIPDIKKEIAKDGETEIPTNDECLDTSKGDFFCKLCDSHMNNVNMWEAHVRGKRHLKNAQKNPGDNISKLRSVKVPGAHSELERLIDETAENELIVGLDFIRETQNINGEVYNCFLCGSCSTNYDIIEHILLAKHRLRYLEKLVTEGKSNYVTAISKLEIGNPKCRAALVDEECFKMVNKYGRGKVEVYLSKS